MKNNVCQHRIKLIAGKSLTCENPHGCSIRFTCTNLGTFP